jgi:ubiquinone/menaquinone biosynthesis C-methylase UbiE
VERDSAPEHFKQRQRTHWDVVAGGWATWLEWTEANWMPLTTWLGETAQWRPGARVLDVACGVGYPALAAALAVRPGGTVMATDLSPAMVALAAKRASERGLDNVEFAEMDAEHLKLGDASFDSATNAYGLMFCPDPSRALDEMHRVLKPGGRVALVTWDEPAKSPYFNVIVGVAAAHLSLPPLGPAAPGPFRLASSARLEALLRDSRFTDIRVESFPMTFECESVDQYCRIFFDVAWKARSAALSDEARARYRDAVAESVRPFVDHGRLRLVATSVRASAVK